MMGTTSGSQLSEVEVQEVRDRGILKAAISPRHSAPDLELSPIDTGGVHVR